MVVGVVVYQQSPTVWAPGTSFLEDSFHRDWAGEGCGSGGHASSGESQMKFHLHTAATSCCVPLSSQDRNLYQFAACKLRNPALTKENWNN